VLLCATAQAVAAHYTAVVILNDSLLFSRAQVTSLVVSLVIFYGWATHDLLAYDACGSDASAAR
jgi:hypothetical protein